jgi:hypothetical protein
MWRRAIVIVRGLGHVGPNAAASRRGHRHSGVRGIDSVASLTVSDKARERNDVGR